MTFITRGDSGIGRGVAVRYAEEGPDGAFVYIAVEEPDAKEAQEAFEREGRCALLNPGTSPIPPAAGMPSARPSSATGTLTSS